MSDYQKISFKVLDPDAVALVNAVLRCMPPCRNLSFLPSGHDSFTEAITGSLLMGSLTFGLAVGGDQFLSLNPHLKSINSNDIPAVLKNAALELLFADSLKALGSFIDSHLGLSFDEVSTESFCNLDFNLTCDGIMQPLRLKIPSKEAARQLKLKLNALPASKSPIDVSTACCQVRVLIGELKLVTNELRELRKSDVLLPEPLYLANDEIHLAVGAYEMCCKLVDHQATVTSLFSPDSSKENKMSDNANENAAAESVDINNLEFKVTFELDRQQMSVSQIAELKVGSTVSVGADLQSPVTIRVNDREIGKGLIVDVGGTLGVQITELNS